MRCEVNHIGSGWRAACALCFVFENNIFMLISQRLLLPRLIIRELHLICALALCARKCCRFLAREEDAVIILLIPRILGSFVNHSREAPWSLIYFCGCFTSHFLLRNYKPKQTPCGLGPTKTLSYYVTKLHYLHNLAEKLVY